MIPDWFTWRDLLVVLVIWLSASAVLAVPLAYVFWRVSLPNEHRLPYEGDVNG